MNENIVIVTFWVISILSISLGTFVGSGVLTNLGGLIFAGLAGVAAGNSIKDLIEAKK